MHDYTVRKNKRKSKNRKSVILILFGIFIIMSIAFPVYFSYSEQDGETALLALDPSITATLYDTDSYGSGTGTALTEEGVTIEDWEYDTSKYLQIDANVPDDGNTYVVTVELPQEFYIVGSELANQSGFQTPEFTKNEGIVINDSFTYELEKYSGTAKYTMNARGTSGTIQLELRYDTVLWDKRSSSSLTKDGVKPIVVTLCTEDETQNLDKLNEVSVNKVTARGSISYTPYMTLGTDEIPYTNSAITVKKDDTVKMRVALLESLQRNIKMYYDSFTIKIQCPKYVDNNGESYYLKPDLTTITLYSIKSTSYQINTDNLETEGTVIINLKNVYYTTGFNILTLSYESLSDELLNLEENTLIFQNGKIFLSAIGKSGVEYVDFSSRPILSITYKKQELENVTVSASSKSVSINSRPEDVVSLIGLFTMENNGTADSTEKEIYEEFDINNTGSVKVTTINIFADTLQEYINVEYTLVDENGNIIYFDENGDIVDSSVSGATTNWIYSVKNAFYNKNSTNNLYTRINRNNLPEKHRNYYYKSIRYKIKTIKSGAKLYNASATAGFASSGNFFGYIDKEAISSQKAKHKITVYSPDDSGISEITKSIETNSTGTNDSAYYIDSIKMSKTSIEAGESFTISGSATCTQYPYGASTWLKGINLGVILPKDVSINEQSITAVTTNNIKITDFKVTSKDIENNNKLWTIKLPRDFYIGYANENLGALSNGYGINFSFQLDTSNIMNNSTLYAKDMLFVAGYNQRNNAVGNYYWSRQIDTYDLNENGSTTDYIGRIQSTDTTNCQIVAKMAELNISDSIIRNNKGTITQESSELPILSSDDIITYNLDIECSNGGRAEETVGFIPIPKKTSQIDNFITEGDINNYFNFNLQGAPNLSGNDIYTIKYTFQEGLNYESAKTLEQWYSKEEIEADSALKWEDVTMIKIIPTDGVIENGNKTRISIDMKYSGENYANEAGSTDIWHSAFYYKYTNGNIVTSGNYVTGGVSANLKYSIDLPDITLTASKDMLPKLEGNVNNYTTLESDIPLFKNNQTFSIVGVETYNVILKTKSYITQNTDMPGIEANETFAITAKMNNGSEQNILESLNTTPVQIGELASENALQFAFKIYNADSISDNTVTRYIIVTFESDNGVTIKQKININREITQATDPKSAIVEGKRYIAFDDTTSQVSISQDSSFTSQFVINYIPATYNEQLIQFSDALPIGTSIVLMNVTDESNIGYWYYKFTTANNNVKLTDFISMGTVNNKNYVYKDTQDSIEEKYLIIVDFSQCETYLQNATHSIKMVFKGNNVSDFNSKELEFITDTKRAFEITTDKDTANINEDLLVSYTTSSQNVADSKYLGRKLSLVITAPEELPLDSYLVQNDNNYYLNNNKQFIIPLKDVQSGDGEVSIKLVSNMFPKSITQYNLKLELWVSATANAHSPMLGEKVGEKQVTFTTLEIPQPALKVESMSKRKIKLNEINQTITLSFNYKSSTALSASIELQKKDGTGYQLITDKLSQVNGTTEHNKGVFTISVAEGINNVNFKLASTTETGTYRIVIKIYDSENKEILEVPYNFLIIS